MSLDKYVDLSETVKVKNPVKSMFSILESMEPVLKRMEQEAREREEIINKTGETK